jgi:hypothetical protein
MERRFRVRLDELLADAEVRPSLLRGLMPRLQAFLKPFVQALHTPEQQTNAAPTTASRRGPIGRLGCPRRIGGLHQGCPTSGNLGRLKS